MLDQPGVTVVLMEAPPSLDPLPRRAHIALSAEMAPVELSRVVSRALRLPAVCGFLVTPRTSSAASSRVVPLSLAAVAPELLLTVRAWPPVSFI